MKSFLMKSVVAFTALVLSAGMAVAGLTVDSAKQQGLVGERTDGTLGIVAGATPEVNALVSSTNQERMEKYNAIAAKNGTGVAQVQALAGKKLIGAAKTGEFVQGADGSWQRK